MEFRGKKGFFLTLIRHYKQMFPVLVIGQPVRYLCLFVSEDNGKCRPLDGADGIELPVRCMAVVLCVWENVGHLKWWL